MPGWRVVWYFYSPSVNSTHIWQVGEWLAPLANVNVLFDISKSNAVSVQFPLPRARHLFIPTRGIEYKIKIKKKKKKSYQHLTI
jgi:hypothetical protein